MYVEIVCYTVNLPGINFRLHTAVLTSRLSSLRFHASSSRAGVSKTLKSSNLLIYFKIYFAFPRMDFKLHV